MAMMIIKIKRSGPGAEEREAADKIFKAAKEAAAEKANTTAKPSKGRATAPSKKKGTWR